MLHCQWNVLESESDIYFMAFSCCWANYFRKWKQSIFFYLWGPRIGADEDETSEEPSLGPGAKCARHLSTIQPIVDQDYKYKSKPNTNIIWLPDVQRISQQSNSSSSLTKELQVQTQYKNKLAIRCARN